MADKVEFVSDEEIPMVESVKSSLDISASLASSNSMVSGSVVYGFQTPKRHGGLAQAASSALHNKTPSNHMQHSLGFHRRETPKGVKIGNRTASSSKCDKTPLVGNSQQGKNDVNSQRQRRQALASKGNEQETDSEDSDCGTSDTGETASRVFRKVTDGSSEQIDVACEAYFDQQSSKCVTSDRTLTSQNIPRMDQQKLLSHLNQVCRSHPRERFDLYHKLQNFFDKWMFQLRNGFNILLYGLGSKRVLLDQFRSTKLTFHLQVVVNGFFPSLTIKDVLNIITDEVLMHDGSFKSVSDQCNYIKQAFANDKDLEELFVIVHNIDGCMLRSKKNQTILSLLAEIEAIHIIASIDHINAPLIWNHTQLGRFNWCWCDVTSFEPYEEETSYENSLLVQHTGALALTSLVHVFRSLTPNARGIFILIAQHQLEEKDNNNYIGLSFRSCYSKCREQFLVNSDSTLKTQLIEFRDHKLITSRKGSDGVEYLFIPVDSATLRQFIDDRQNNNI
ncbi:origin recognition complex subunit 2-like isoform X2 [Acropora millepora]|uniref:origin recognition complex subunit 2-like isoform X2 n=1 Tax=Acropora millepora TaxID=45264 RepID=UPI001CF504E3|nr:origin recognition complex subunit 2-like isoform X2 [Acropora millepora]